MLDEQWSPGFKPNTPCIVWPRCGRNGYSLAQVNGKKTSAHRMAAAMRYGPEAIIGRSVMHACDNKSCFNPDHLFLGDHQLNALDWHAKRPALPLSAADRWFRDQVLARQAQLA